MGACPTRREGTGFRVTWDRIVAAWDKDSKTAKMYLKFMTFQAGATRGAL